MKHETYNLTPFDNMLPLCSQSRLKAYRSLRRKSERRYYRYRYGLSVRYRMLMALRAVRVRTPQDNPLFQETKPANFLYN